MSSVDAAAVKHDGADANASDSASQPVFWLRVRRLLQAAAVVYLGCLGLLVLFESSLVYPRPLATSGNWQPTEFPYEEVRFSATDGVELFGWYVPHPQPRGVMVVYHGNGRHLPRMAEDLEVLRDRYQLTLFAFDYRGYGRSAGKPFERGILDDGCAAQRWLADREGIATSEVFLFGRSLGGAVAVAVAAKQGAKGLVLDRTFHSMVEIAAEMYPWAPVRWLMRNRYPSAERITAYDGPLLQLHGRTDEVVPFDSGEKLFKASPSEAKQFIAVDRLGHNDLTPPVFFRALDDFLTRHAQPASEVAVSEQPAR